MVRTAVAGTSTPGTIFACSICAVAKKPGFNRPVALGTIASIVSARVSAVTDGDTKRTWPVNVSSGIRIDLERHRAAGGDRGYILLGHRELDPQRVNAHHRCDLGAAGHVVAHRNEALANHACKRRSHGGVGECFLRHGDARTGCEQRLVLLQGAVAGHVVLPLGGFGLRLLLIELRLREQLLLVQPLRALQFRPRQLQRRAGIRHFCDTLHDKRLSGADAEPRLDLRGVRPGFGGLRLALSRGNP